MELHLGKLEAESGEQSKAMRSSRGRSLRTWAWTLKKWRASGRASALFAKTSEEATTYVSF